jgi:peptidoglycan/xylan/chitin deacetylase (PgdA/CDA1 family)
VIATLPTVRLSAPARRKGERTEDRDAFVVADPQRRARSAPERLARAAVARSAGLLGSVTRVSTSEPVIALTFDDGPHPVDTPALLDVLDRHGAKATFFVVGRSAQRHPEILRRMAEAGHAVGNHTWDHCSMPALSGRYRRRQLAWTEETLGDRSAGLFRPPFGEQSLGARIDVARAGLDVVCWDVVAEDWRDDPPEIMLARVYRGLRRGSIVLLHDTLHTAVDERFRDRSATRAAVEELLVELGRQYRFVTVPQLLALGRPVRWHWYRRSRLERLRQAG